MASTNTRFTCQQCDGTEDKCTCTKYCCLCNGLEGVRLCGDGLFYCEPCREVCDYQPETRLGNS
jgi:hypothetical protein